MKKNLFNIIALLVVTLFILTGCGIEHHYYHENHHHSPEYNTKHHHEQSPIIDLNIHN